MWRSVVSQVVVLLVVLAATRWDLLLRLVVTASRHPAVVVFLSNVCGVLLDLVVLIVAAVVADWINRQLRK